MLPASRQGPQQGPGRVCSLLLLRPSLDVLALLAANAANGHYMVDRAPTQAKGDWC